MKTIVFFNTGWMTRYEGESDTDPIQGGGKHVETYHSGGEMFNFKPRLKKVYGYVQPVGGTLNLERILASADGDKLEDVTVVWTARHPTKGGTRVIGWYTSATLYRAYQEIDFSRPSSWNWMGREAGYFATAHIENVQLLTPDARTLLVPRGKGGMGRSNVWYADDSPAFIKEVRALIKRYAGGTPPTKPPRQPDVLKRLEVEKKAVELVIDYYEALGYALKSVEKDNVGWDLEAIHGKSALKLEVKGLSGPDLVIELTSNEYKKLNAHRTSYRICVVTQALTAPELHIFSYIQEVNKPGATKGPDVAGAWVSANGKVLALDEVISARGHCL